jgi:DNA topoisomerase III
VKRIVLAEKPSVARDLAAFVKARTRRDGYFENDQYVVTWAFGHLVGLKEPGEYDPAWKRWSLESLPMVPPRFELKAIGDAGARKQLDIVARLFREADEIVCATDAGREGELIFRYILEYANPGAKKLLRLWLNSLTEEAIADAFGKLRPASDFDHLGAAARCRSEADWLVGLNGTRYFTSRHRRFDCLWTVGRVQTPVLAMIVGRDDEIRAFVPEIYFELATNYRGVKFKHPGQRFATRDAAAELLARIRMAEFAISSVTKKKETSNPPQLFDLTELQREMNRRHGMSAQETLDAAQALYEAKLLTYPRTDSRYLPEEMRKQMPDLLSNLRGLKSDAIGKLDLAKLKENAKVFDDAKVSDHHAILPTGRSPGPLAPAHAHVFDAVFTRLIAVFYPSCVKEVTTAIGAADGVEFKARGVRVVEPGWTALYPKRAEKKADKKGESKTDADDYDTEEQEMPLFEKGESGPHEPALDEGKTRPPRAYDENTLLAAMETAGKSIEDEALREAMKERGLGTPATRASIIETLISRCYVVRDKKKLTATDLGRFLVYLVHDENLKSPELTGDWEAKLKAIEQGKLDAATFMAGIVDYTRSVVRGEKRIDVTRLGACPRCDAPVIQGKRGYGCSRWKEGCDFVLWMEWNGISLTPNHARQLLQRRILLDPVETSARGKSILVLTAKGALLDLAVPSREAQNRPPRTPTKMAPAAKPEAGGAANAAG